MAATAGHSLTLDPMGINTKFFLSETTKPIELNFCMNDYWMDVYKSYVLFVDRENKMAATAELSLTLDPMGNSFKSSRLELLA